jgi:SRSO17 transposase
MCVSGVEVEVWTAELESLFARVAPRFGRVEARRRMQDYVRGLLGPVGRKNSWQVAEYAGHGTPDGLQRLLNSSAWDPDLLRDELRAYVAERLGEAGGVLILDDTGFVKKGRTSAGVSRQYTGTSGKVDNCQIGVFAAYASSKGRALVDRELYLPKCWTEDPARCRAAKVPAQRGFATKNELARAMIARSLGAGLPVAWVAADEAYGQEWKLRRLCEERGVGYVLAVPKSQQVRSSAGMRRIDALVGWAPPEAWERHTAGAGAKGERLYDWAAALLPPVAEFDEHRPDAQRWLLARRSISDPGEIAYYLAYAPHATGTAELARIAGMRWAIEECFQAAKNETGLDEYEVRRYPGWYRHITLAMLAHAFLAALAAQAAEKGEPLNQWSSTHPSPWARSDGSWHA